MSPDPKQVFVVLFALTCAGVIGATLLESGAISRALNPQAAAETTASVSPNTEAATGPDGAPAAAPGDELPDDLAGSGANSDGSGNLLDAELDGDFAEGIPGLVPFDDEEDANEGAVPSEEPTGEWAPLRRAERGEPCLVRTNRAMMATGLNRREPVGTEGPFTANGEPILVFMDFANSTGMGHPITVIWRHDNGTTYFDTAEAGAGSRWRTWAERPLPLDQLGHWTVQLVDSERCLVDELEFDLVAPQW